MTLIFDLEKGALKLRDRKMRNQWCQVWGTKNAVLENAGPEIETTTNSITELKQRLCSLYFKRNTT